MYLTGGMLIICLVSLIMLSVNIVNIITGKINSDGSTMDLDSNSSIKNDQYTIGNNPTDFGKEVFEDLTKSLEDGDPLEISKNVVRCFISDYFTWTNKDGTYEVGGLQYVYGPQYTMFEVESRWTFYSDLDLYITQYGREKLLEVDSIEIIAALDGGYFTVEGASLKSYYIEATWTYKDSSALDVEEFQQVGFFTVVDHGGRYEIASFYDSYD